jgi:hypothetical protein
VANFAASDTSASEALTPKHIAAITALHALTTL